ncbi:MAG: PH domain-containing protein [Vicinamibacteria bacterium]
MFDWVKSRVLRLMRVPHEPEPPIGAPGSVRVFRAGLNLYYLRVARWALGQSGALVGIGFSLVMLGMAESAVDRAHREALVPRPSPTATATPDPSAPPVPAAKRRAERKQYQERVWTLALTNTPAFVLPVIKFIEFGGIALFALQALVSYSIVRLEFEQHWYIVTDRSLRIRTGILRLQESTMSFANIQQVEIRQGPLQRALGLADVLVRSAGGSEPEAGPKSHGADHLLHMGRFEGVANADEIRNLILERLRRFRQAGLGDPDDKHAHDTDHGHEASAQLAVSHLSTDEAVHELLAEARALRGALLVKA